MSIALYELIKQKSQELGRPLKIVCDWDEVIQPLKPIAIYEVSAKNKSFEEFFKEFWENVILEGTFSGSGGRIVISDNSKIELQEAVNRWAEQVKLMREKFVESVYSNPEYIKKRENAPYLSITKDLLLCLKDNLISEIMVISSYRGKNISEAKFSGVVSVKKKQEKFPKMFGRIPNCRLELTGVLKNEKGDYIPCRYQRIMELMPDFDIFIDDNPNIIKETLKALMIKPEKVYVMLDYRNCRGIEAPNVYHVKNTVSDLKDEDFAIAALEMKNKQLEQELKTTKQEREREREHLKATDSLSSLCWWSRNCSASLRHFG